jgi:hypothetical protein
MTITFSDCNTETSVSRDGITWMDAMDIFLDVLRGSGYILPTNANDEIIDAIRGENGL